MHHAIGILFMFMVIIQEFAVAKGVVAHDTALRCVIAWGMLGVIWMLFALIEEVGKKK